MKTLVQFGAGNIGRSFIGQLFARNGFEVIFVDVVDRIVELLNERHSYRLVIKRNNRADEIINIENVRAINAKDASAVAQAVANADYVATSVGKNALPFIFPNLAQGIALREKLYPGRPIDIIIAENIHNGAAFFRESLGALLSQDFPLSDRVGLVETSIGKMVPIMRAEDIQKDPLWVFSEEYNELIVDRHGFLGPLPNIDTLNPVENIKAYVDRKLFIHNMGHAATAYLGYAKNPDITYIWEALEDPQVLGLVQSAMRESAAALVAAYPNDMEPVALEEHIANLLDRFQNRALGDTVFRVGRDLYRKLDREDRLVGAVLLAAQYGLPYNAIAEAIRASLRFKAVGEDGKPYPTDAEFLAKEAPRGLRHVLISVSRLNENNEVEQKIIDVIDGQER
ncbi:MAG TPA: mannitol-1-phosphate 5-dehydrogenase [Spirochaetales bacterium]|nr:mannitol-1-phosphate 5-dehydrogenase [Spirochaetales bacterium]